MAVSMLCGRGTRGFITESLPDVSGFSSINGVTACLDVVADGGPITAFDSISSWGAVRALFPEVDLLAPSGQLVSATPSLVPSGAPSNTLEAFIGGTALKLVFLTSLVLTNIDDATISASFREITEEVLGVVGEPILVQAPGGLAVLPVALLGLAAVRRPS